MLSSSFSTLDKAETGAAPELGRAHVWVSFTQVFNMFSETKYSPQTPQL